MSGQSDGMLVLFTVGTAFLGALCMLPVGVLLGWWLSRWRNPLRHALETLCLLPLVLPPTAVGLLLLLLLQPHGPVGEALASAHAQVLFTWRAVVVAGAIMGLPFLVRGSRDAFALVDPRLLPMARTLGAGPWSAFTRVALPLAWRGILSGFLFAFARALGEFGATILVAGNIPGKTQTLALAIFERIQGGEDMAALRLALVSVGLALLAVAATEVVNRRSRTQP